MRWPIRFQIFAAMAIIVVLVVLGVSLTTTLLQQQISRRQIDQSLQDATTVLSNSSFRLTGAVLSQMRGLSGAEFMITDDEGQIISTTLPQATLTSQLARPVGSTSWTEIADRRFLHSVFRLGQPRQSGATTVHIFYPEERYLRAEREFYLSALVVGAVCCGIALFISMYLANRVTWPLRQLQQQVDEIADGSFAQISMARTNDEIADLSQSVNTMSEKLRGYEHSVRRNEQLRTLGQLGAGVAHQMRNAVTGCRLAVELHARQCEPDNENISVAMRQLDLMESHLKRFLSLGRESSATFEPVEVRAMVDDIVTLIRPTADHLQVTVGVESAASEWLVQCDAGALRQAVANLVLNAVEAAAEPNATEAAAEPNAESRVQIVLKKVDDDFVLTVSDSGSGPQPELGDKVFEPFTTGKPDGTGLGLAIAREVAENHGGKIQWFRRADQTHFELRLPICHTG